MPTGWPALSLHCSAGAMLSRNSAVVPTSASELPHAVVIAFCASSAVSFESAVLHDHLAAGEAAVGVDVLAPRLHAVDRALEQTGTERRAGVGDDGDRDRRRADADLARRELRRLARDFVGGVLGHCCGQGRRVRVVAADLLAAATSGRNQHDHEQYTDPAEALQGSPSYCRRPADLMGRQIGKCEPAPRHVRCKLFDHDSRVITPSPTVKSSRTGVYRRSVIMPSPSVKNRTTEIRRSYGADLDRDRCRDERARLRPEVFHQEHEVPVEAGDGVSACGRYRPRETSSASGLNSGPSASASRARIASKYASRPLVDVAHGAVSEYVRILDVGRPARRRRGHRVAPRRRPARDPSRRTGRSAGSGLS